MITKAGVPSTMVVVGITSYGRSFQMTTPGCTSSQCTFTGSLSGATPGRCTGTAGYIADAEIKEIIAQDTGVTTWVDNASDTDIVVYNTTQWIAYMSVSRKEARTILYQNYHFGGVGDWAIDLEDFLSIPGSVYVPPTSPSSTTDPAWATFKENLKDSGNPNCNRANRTGTWVATQCNAPAVASPLQYISSDRWADLDCDNAWSDAKYRWTNCDKPAENGSFSDSVYEFFHLTEEPNCGDLAADSNCDDTFSCVVHNTASDAADDQTGAAAYMVANALVVAHEVRVYLFSGRI